MQVIHSFWSKAYFHGRWDQEQRIHMDLYSFALSYHYAKELYGSVNLVTDTQGLELFKCIPYDAIDLGLDEMKHINPGFWTAGKIKAIQQQNHPVLHIDGDVFLMGKDVKKLLKGKWDVAVQMREVGQHYDSTYPQIFKHIDKVWPWIQDLSLFNFAYNNGILGFKNQDFKSTYCFEYFELLRMLDLSGITFPAKADPNVVVEQSLLTKLAQVQNVHVKELITLQDMDIEGLFEFADRIGFVHLWGNSKYQESWHQRVKAKLKEVNPKLYKSVSNKIKSL
jgi:hypothetical protein